MHAAALRVVIAPDSFKGSISARDAAVAIAEGWRAARPGDELRLLPMADGGEGTIDTVAAAMPEAQRVPVEVLGPDGRPVRTHWLRLPDGSALVELAACSGLTLLPESRASARGSGPAAGERELRPRTAHSFGTGQAVRAAIDAGVRRVFVALGGSASSDGGAGMLAAMGARLENAEGRPIALGNLGLEDLAAADLGGVALPPEGLVAWTDVRSPLLGAAGAVAVFGPQKGLVGEDAAEAERALERFAALLGGDPSTPGSGAAGGAGFALVRLGARMASGSSAVADAIGLPQAVAAAELVITGEGCFDEQSVQGKVVSLVSALAEQAGARTALVAGAVRADPRGFEAVVPLTALAAAGELHPMRDARELLRRAGGELARACS